METFLKSIGVGEEITGDLEQVQIAFQRPAVLWIGLLLLIPVAYFVYVRQRNNLGTVPKRFRVALSVMRVSILAILIVVASGPYLKIDHRVTKKPIFAVLFDSSQSMKLPAGPFASDQELLQAASAAGTTITSATDEATIWAYEGANVDSGFRRATAAATVVVAFPNAIAANDTFLETLVHPGYGNQMATLTTLLTQIVVTQAVAATDYGCFALQLRNVADDGLNNSFAILFAGDHAYKPANS